jgi:hypothetical protein
MKKIIFQNKKILSFLILFLLIIILTLRTNFLKNLFYILRFNESVRIEKIYGYCGHESIGYLKYLKKKYKIETNPRILNYDHTPPTKWSIYVAGAKENDDNQIIILNYPVDNESNIELHHYKDNFYELLDTHYYSLLYESIKEIEIKNYQDPIINIEFYTKDGSNKLIMLKNLKLDKDDNKNNYIINQKLDVFNIREKRFFLKFDGLKIKTKIFLTLNGKYNLDDYEIIDNFKNCYLVK